MFMAKLYKDLDSDMIGQYLEYLPSILECHEVLPIKMRKKVFLNKIEIILQRDMLFLIIQSVLFYGFISYCIIKSKWHF